MRHISRFEKAILSLENHILTTASIDSPQNVVVESKQHKIAEGNDDLVAEELVLEEADSAVGVVRADRAASIPTAEPGSDRRQYPRHLSSGKVTVCPIEKDSLCYPQALDWQMHSSQLRGTIMDISMNGVAIVLDKPVRVGTSVAMVLDWFHVAEEVQTRGHVIRSAEIQETNPSQLWLITVQLDRRLTFEQVRTLGHRLQSPMS